MPVEIIEPNENEECCCCGSSDVKLNKWKNRDKPVEDGNWHQHCDLCYSTLAGNYCRPSSVDVYERAELMKHVCAVGNMVLKEMRKMNV